MTYPVAPPPLNPANANLLQELLVERINRYTSQLVQAVGMKVQNGPFAGMLLPRQFSWGGGYLGPKILGSYEAELHTAVEKGIARKPDVVINVGCAEGFYAIGLARRLPKARVFAFDIDEAAQASCAAAAAENGVAEQVTVLGRCDAAQLMELTRGCRRALIVLDCEGGELELLSDDAVKALAHCDLIVELHDFVDRTITSTLTARLAARKVALVREGARDPSGIPLLSPIGSFDRALMVCEFRPELMHWMVSWGR